VVNSWDISILTAMVGTCPPRRSNGVPDDRDRMGDRRMLQKAHLNSSKRSHDWAIADYPGATLARVQCLVIPCDK
jgi:hypothetical protein